MLLVLSLSLVASVFSLPISSLEKRDPMLKSLAIASLLVPGSNAFLPPPSRNTGFARMALKQPDNLNIIWEDCLSQLSRTSTISDVDLAVKNTLAKYGDISTANAEQLYANVHEKWYLTFN